MNTFFNSEIKSGVLLEEIGNFCFTPVRTLFEGKTYVQVDKVFLSKESKESQNVCVRILKVALAALLFLPGVALGTLFKGLSFIYPSVRESTYALSQAKSQTAFRRVLMESESLRIYLDGDPKELDPSVASIKENLPFGWLKENISKPEKMDLKDLPPSIVERMFKGKQHDFSSLVELDISFTELVEPQVLKIIKKCSNLITLKVENLQLSQAAYATIVDSAKNLSPESKQNLGECIPIVNEKLKNTV